MRADRNLIRRGSTWSLRIAVPKKLQDLRTIAGLPVKKEVWRSLGASDLRQIRSSLTKIKAQLIEGFENEMNRLTEYIARPLPTDEQLQRAVSRFRMDMRESLRQDRIGLPTALEVERAVEGHHLVTLGPANVRRLDTRANAWAVLIRQLEFDGVIGAREALETRRAILRDELYRHMANNNFVLVGWAIDEIAERDGYRIDQNSHTFKRLGHELIAAWILELDGADDNFMELAKPVAPAVAIIQAPGGISSNDDRVASSQGRSTSPARDIRELFETYMAEQKADIAISGRAERNRTIAQFVEVCGLRDVADYRKADMAAFKGALKRLPINAARDYPGLSTLELIERAGAKARTLKPKTINLRLSIISVFGKWLADTVDGVEAENFSTAPLKITGTSDKMEEFTDHQVCQILLSPAFTGSESERDQSRPGAYRVRDYRFWLPLLAAYTGCRLNELTQLRLDDVVQRDDVWVLQITDQGDEQSLKIEAPGADPQSRNRARFPAARREGSRKGACGSVSRYPQRP